MRRMTVVLVAVVLVLPCLVFGQPFQEPGAGHEEFGMGPEMGEPGGGQGSGQKDAKFHDRMETVWVYKLVEYLDLTTEEAVKLAPAIKEQKNIRKVYQEKKEKMLDAIADLMEKGSESADLKKAVAGIQKLEAELSVKTQEQTKKVLALLPLEKQAKYYLFERQFAGKVRQGLNRMTERKGQRQQPGGGRNRLPQTETPPPDEIFPPLP